MIFKPLMAVPALVVALSVVPAMAQPFEAPRGVSGAIVSVADDTVVLKPQAGATVTVAMTTGWTVVVVRPVGHDAIKPGAFVASANQGVDDQTGRASELRIFEPGYEPEHGTHAIGAGRTGLMTHGAVTKVVETAAGTEVDVTYAGGSRHLIVPADVPVYESFVVDRARAAPGVEVGAVTRKGDDGIWRASRLTLTGQSR